MEQIGFLDLEQTSSRPNSDITGFNQDEREFAVVGVYDGTNDAQMKDLVNDIKVLMAEYKRPTKENEK